MLYNKFQLEFALEIENNENYLELKMLAQNVLMDSDSISQSLDSGPEGLDLCQVSTKPEQRKIQCTECRVWKPICRAKKASQHIKKKKFCLPSASQLDWVIKSLTLPFHGLKWNLLSP